MTTPTPYISQQPVDDFSLRFSNFLYSAKLTFGAGDISFSVPLVASRFKALIKVRYGDSVWVAINQTASFPTGGSFSSTTSELVNGTLCREVKGGDVLHFITDLTSVSVSVSFYALGTNN